MMDVGIGNSFERGLICYAADAATGSGMEVDPRVLQAGCDSRSGEYRQDVG